MFNNLKFIDIHYHADPDLYKRRYNAIDAGERYLAAQGAVVLRSHLGSTSNQATLAQQKGLPVFPSVVLNNINGGIHYKAILRALAEYQPMYPSKLIVDLPTITGRKHKSKLSRSFSSPNLVDNLCYPETIFSSDNKIKDNIRDICRLAGDFPIVLSTGHSSKEELYALIDVCLELRVPSLLLNQPANPLTGLKASDFKEISQLPFVWIEQTALTYLLSYQSEDDFKEVLKDVKNVVYSSDLGQTTQMDVFEWRSVSDKWFNQFDISISRKAEICLINPVQLLQI